MPSVPIQGVAFRMTVRPMTLACPPPHQPSPAPSTLRQAQGERSGDRLGFFDSPRGGSNWTEERARAHPPAGAGWAEHRKAAPGFYPVHPVCPCFSFLCIVNSHGAKAPK